MSVGFCRFVTPRCVHESIRHAMRDKVTTKRTDAIVAAIAAKQHGVFSVQQVVEVGGSRALVHRRIAAGRWVRLSCGALAFAGSPVSFHAQVVAACLRAGDWSFASHETASQLWLATGASVGVHLWSPSRVRATGISAHRGRLEKSDVTRLGAIPITRPERTLIDLASTSAHEQLEGTLDEFLRRELIQLRRLEKRLAAVGGSGRRGVRFLRSLIDERRDAGVSESELETRLLRALREERLPIPLTQYEIRHEGRLVARADFAYPEVKLAIEAYGKGHHSTWVDQEHDLARQNELIALGWRVVVVTWSRLHQERTAVMRTISRALAA
jgi:very-short-patch-repair endonuclease